MKLTPGTWIIPENTCCSLSAALASSSAAFLAVTDIGIMLRSATQKIPARMRENWLRFRNVRETPQRNCPN